MNSLLYKFIWFAFFKGVIFFSVLLFSYTGYSKEYVDLESGIAKAMMLVPFLSLGLTTSYAHYKINKKDCNIDEFYWGYLVFLLSSLFLLSFAFILSNSQYIISFLTAACLLGSRFCSQKYKNNSDVIKSSFFDASFYIFLVVIFLVVMLEVDFKKSFIIFLLILVALFLLFSVREFRKCIPTSKNINGVEFFTFGGKSLFVSALSAAVMVSPRAIAESYINMSELEIFYLTLRYSAITVLVYQFFSIYMFRKIYSIKSGNIALLSLSVYVLSFVFTAIVLLLLERFGVLKSLIFFFFSSHLTALWVTSSFLEYFISREGGIKIYVITALIFSLICFSLYFIFELNKQSAVLFFVTMFVFAQFFSVFYKSYINPQVGS